MDLEKQGEISEVYISKNAMTNDLSEYMDLDFVSRYIFI